MDKGEPKHGPEHVGWDMGARGWYMSCLCGWHTGSKDALELTGKEFDEHLAMCHPRDIVGFVPR